MDRRRRPYFAYGTLQKGFPNWPELAHRLGDPVGRFRTVEPHVLVVPIQPGCANPGCRLLHRMAALVPGGEGYTEGGVVEGGIDEGGYVEGDLFMVDPLAIAAIDRLEGYDAAQSEPGPYVRVEIAVAALGGGDIRIATAYRVRDPAPWRALVATGRAEVLTCYGPRLAKVTLKQCCAVAPGHAGPHDVIDVFGNSGH